MKLNATQADNIGIQVAQSSATLNSLPVASGILSEREVNRLIGEFEAQWEQAPSFLYDFVQQAGVGESIQVVAELIRVDIDRRYSRGASVELEAYFRSFPDLLQDSEALTGVAFEDFRVRGSMGLVLDPLRWQHLPGVSTQTWYRELLAGKGVFGYTPPNLIAYESAGRTSVPYVGGRFGDFQLLYLLGRGAFSEVYLARQCSLANRYVAVKIVRQLLGEPSHLARMQHTGIVPLFSLHRVGEYSVLCMPYAGAATLADWLRTGPTANSQRDGQSFVDTVHTSLQQITVHEVGDSDKFTGVPDELRVWNESGAQPLNQLQALDSAEFVVWFAHRLASALAHAHLRGIVHGDLKPANILIRNDGEPALIDFNLSESQAAVPNIVGGTLPYMAPEQLHSLVSRRSTISTASDVFALGVILYEMVEGGLPYAAAQSASEVDLLNAIEGQRTTQLQWRSRAVSQGTKAIISKCLALDITQRYEDGNALLRDLERERLNLPLVVAREPLVSRIAKLTRRYPRLFSGSSVGAVALLIVCAVAVIAASQWQQARRLKAHSTFRTVQELTASTITDLLAFPSHRTGDVLTPWSRLHEIVDVQAGRSPSQAAYLQWLPTQTAALARKDLFDFSLSAAFLLYEQQLKQELTRKQLNSHPELRQYLEFCAEFPEYADGNPVMQVLQASTGQNVPTPPVRSSAANNTSALDGLLLARLALINKDFDQVPRLLAALPEASPFQTLFLLTLGESQLNLRQYQEARLSLSSAAAQSPNCSLIYRLRAEAAAGLRDFESAIRDYTRAVSLSPGHAALLADQARMHELHGQIELALKNVDEALRLAPSSNRLLIYRSRLLQQLGRARESTLEFRRALETQPQSETDWISRALARSKNDPQGALADLEAALKMNPASLTALQNLAYVQAELLKDTPAAIDTLTRLLDIDADFEMARGGRCVLYGRAGQPELAQQDIDFLLQSEAQLLPPTVYQIACAYCLIADSKPEHVQSALRFIARALQLNYGKNLLAVDPDLENIRDAPQFQQLIDWVGLLDSPP